MSNNQAIAAVTSCLQQLIEKAFDVPVTVTTRPLDKAHTDPSSKRLNLFLYSIGPNAAWRNRDLPTERPGERGRPPLALNLQYLLTAYADDDVESHKLLGTAVGALSDRPILLPSELSTPPGVSSAPNALFERVHVTLQTMTIEDLSKLWGAFQSQYRLSVAYEASAVLIESQQEARASLPVLSLGTDGRGPVAGASLSPFPLLERVTPDAPRASETVTVVGRNLVTSGSAGSIQIVLSRLGEEVRRIAKVTIAPRGDLPPGIDTLTFTVPADAPPLEAGVYGVSALVTTDDQLGKQRTYASNEVLMSIAPRIAKMTPGTVKAGAKSAFSVVCDPQPGATQRVRLFIGLREFKPTPGAGAGLTFAAENLTAGDHVVRLRVDGVDSLRVVQRDSVVEFEKPDILTVTP